MKDKWTKDNGCFDILIKVIKSVVLDLGIGQVAVEGWKRHRVQIQNFCARK